MEEQAGEMVASGRKAIEGHVERVGKPGEGVPVVGVDRREGPRDAGAGKAGVDVGVVDNIVAIVITGEAVLERGREDRANDGGQNEAGEQGFYRA